MYYIFLLHGIGAILISNCSFVCFNPLYKSMNYKMTFTYYIMNKHIRMFLKLESQKIVPYKSLCLWLEFARYYPEKNGV